MTKIRTTLTIEKEIFENAKKHIPNLSAFIEECLENYLGYANGTYPTANEQEIIDKIGRLQAELFILNKNYDVEESRNKAEKEKLNRTWYALWNDYQRQLKPNPNLLNDAVNVLGLDSETIEDILDFTYENSESLSFGFTWNEIYEKYQQEEEVN